MYCQMMNVTQLTMAQKLSVHCVVGTNSIPRTRSMLKCR